MWPPFSVGQHHGRWSSVSRPEIRGPDRYNCFPPIIYGGKRVRSRPSLKMIIDFSKISSSVLRDSQGRKGETETNWNNYRAGGEKLGPGAIFQWAITQPNSFNLSRCIRLSRWLLGLTVTPISIRSVRSRISRRKYYTIATQRPMTSQVGTKKESE